MTKLQILKEDCLKKEKIVEELNGDLCKKIILRDLRALQSIDSSMIAGETENRFFRDKLIMTVTSNGMLEIEDRRGEAFLWVFEIEHEIGFRLGDAFKVDNKIYSVKYLEESEATDIVIEKVEEVIKAFEDSIDKLKSDISLDAWKYKYYDCHEEVTCNSLQGVIETVLGRKYKKR